MVSQGQQYTPGEPTFDAFFRDLHEAQVLLGQAPMTQQQIRANLAQALEVANASSDVLIERLEQLAAEAERSGAGIRLRMPDLNAPNLGSQTLAAQLDVAGRPLDDRARGALAAAERAANEELQLVTQTQLAKQRMSGMHSAAISLEPQVDAVFRKGGPSKKAEVRKNLTDAQKLVPLMGARADEILQAAREFLPRVSQALTRNEKAFNPAPPPPAVNEDEAPQAKPAKSKGGGKSAPAKPTPAPAGDFEP
jgi:hypothetical protein